MKSGLKKGGWLKMNVQNETAHLTCYCRKDKVIAKNWYESGYDTEVAE